MTAESAVLVAAEELLVQRLQPAILNHSARVFELARAIAAHEGCPVDVAALRIASLFHDAGTADEYDGPQRFEVEGADAAAAFLSAQGWDATRVDSVWEAIALHTSPQIAERRGPFDSLPPSWRSGRLWGRHPAASRGGASFFGSGEVSPTHDRAVLGRCGCSAGIAQPREGAPGFLARGAAGSSSERSSPPGHQPGFLAADRNSRSFPPRIQHCSSPLRWRRMHQLERRDDPRRLFPLRTCASRLMISEGRPGNCPSVYAPRTLQDGEK